MRKELCYLGILFLGTLYVSNFVISNFVPAPFDEHCTVVSHQECGSHRGNWLLFRTCSKRHSQHHTPPNKQHTSADTDRQTYADKLGSLSDEWHSLRLSIFVEKVAIGI